MAQRKAVEARLTVRVQPGARSSEVLGFQDDVLRVRVAAPPREGKANQALVALLAETLGVAPSHIRVIRGHASRQKLVAIEGVEAEAVRQALSAPRQG
jgi:uncharacterized protein (TIGR00251 family)